MKHTYSSSVDLTVLWVLTFCWCGQLSCIAAAQENRAKGPVFASKAPARVEALIEQREADQRRITIREANLFHRHFIDTCMEVMPQNLTLGYCGILATDDGRHPLRVYGIEFAMEDVVVIGDETAAPNAEFVTTTEPGGFIPIEETHPLGEALHWAVGDEDMIGVFGLWISTQPTKQSVAKCKMEGKQLFVNVDLVKHGQSVDARLPELGGRSVREVLKHIEKAGPKSRPKPGLPERVKPLPTTEEGSPDGQKPAGK